MLAKWAVSRQHVPQRYSRESIWEVKLPVLAHRSPPAGALPIWSDILSLCAHARREICFEHHCHHCLDHSSGRRRFVSTAPVNESRCQTFLTTQWIRWPARLGYYSPSLERGGMGSLPLGVSNFRYSLGQQHHTFEPIRHKCTRFSIHRHLNNSSLSPFSGQQNSKIPPVSLPWPSKTYHGLDRSSQYYPTSSRDSSWCITNIQ